MLYVNLIPHRPMPKERKPLPWALALGGLAVALAVWWTVPRSGFVSRPLGIEEKEAVVLLLSGVERRYPEMAAWIEEARDALTDGSLEATVESAGTALLHYEDESLVFNSRFFDSDSAQQEKALVEAVFALRQGSRREEPEVAVSSGD